MKIGITGLGFIGSTLLDLLLRKGHEVVGMDNRHKENLDNIISMITNPNFKFILGDVSEDDDVKKFYDTGLDYVVHTSGIVGYPAVNRWKALSHSTNVVGTELMVKHKPDNVGIMFTSTGSVYSVDGEICTEKSRVDPPSLYGQQKLIGEKIILSSSRGLCWRFATAAGVGFSILRVNLLLNDLVQKAVSEKSISIFEPSFVRTFLNIFDLTEAIYITILQFDKLLDDENRIYNIGNDELNISKGDLALLIQKKTNCAVFMEDKRKDWDKRNYSLSSKKFCEKTGWVAKIGLEKTIDDLIKVCEILTPWSRYN